MAYSRDLSKMAIIDYQGWSRTIKDYQGLSSTVKGYQGLPIWANSIYWHTDWQTYVGTC